MPQPSLDEIFSGGAVAEKPSLDSIFKTDIPTDKPSLDNIFKAEKPSLDTIFKSGIESAKKTIGESIRTSFGPLISEAITPTPIGQPALKAVSTVFDYGISRPIATALSGWPGFEEKLSQAKGLKDKFVALGKGLTSETFADMYRDTYKDIIKDPEQLDNISRSLGGLADAVSQIGIMHFGAKAISPAYKTAVEASKAVKSGVKATGDFAIDATDFVAKKIAVGLEDIKLKADFIKEFTPKVGKKVATNAYNELAKIIKEPIGTTTKADTALNQLYPGLRGKEGIIERPGIVQKAPVRQPIDLTKVPELIKAEIPKAIPTPPKAEIVPIIAPEVAKTPIVEPTGIPLKGETPPTAKGGEIGIKFTREGDAVGREYHETVSAIDPKTGKKMGYIKHSYSQGESSVQMVEVKPEYRKKGVGLALLNELQSQSEKPLTIMGNFATKEGQALWKKFQGQSKLSPTVAKGGEIAPELQSLAEEAKKYKTVGEFIQSLDTGHAGVGSHVPYSPSKRLLEMNIGKDTLADAGMNPDEIITVYRGVDTKHRTGKISKAIQPGDYVATSWDLAKSYTGSDADVVSMKIKAKEFYTELYEEMGNDIKKKGIENTHLEGVYSPNKPLTNQQLTDIYNKSKLSPTAKGGEIAFKYQDANQENLAKTGFASGDTSAQFEAGGDIFRELTKDAPDSSYIKEKISSINRYWDRFDIRKDGENLALLKKQWEGQPTNTQEQKLAKELNLAIISRDKSKVDSLLSKLSPKEGIKVEKKQYIAIVDQSHPTMKNKFWMSNQIKGLTEKQAKPLLEKGKVREVSEEDVAPKKFVDIVEPDGTTKRMTWGEYLKYKNSLKQPITQTTTTKEKLEWGKEGINAKKLDELAKGKEERLEELSGGAFLGQGENAFYYIKRANGTKVINPEPIKNEPDTHPDDLATNTDFLYEEDAIEAHRKEELRLHEEQLNKGQKQLDLGKLSGREGFIKTDMLNPAKWDSVRQFIEDDWLRVKRLIQQKGANVTETNNPYEAEIRYWGRIGARTEEADQLISEVDKDIVTTAKKLNISDKLLSKDIDRFLIARHAPERNAQHGENAAGMTDKQAFEIRAEIAGKPYASEVERIADEIQTLNNKTLDILLESEVISKELYDKLRTMYKNHIPLNRVMSENDDIVEVLIKRGFDVQGPGIKRAKGSELEIADILTNVVTNYKAALARSEKNIVDNYTLRFARENEYFDGLFEEVKLPMLPVGKIQHRAAVDSGYLAQVKTFAESLGAKVVTGGQPGRVLGTYGGKTVERKFATPEEVVSHEVGHFLDDKYKLKQKFYKKGDTKKVGEEIYKFMVDQGQSANRVKKVSERFAHAFEWWLSNRALAKEDLPLFTKSIEGIISEIPELAPLLKIRPTPGLTVESIEQMVFARQKYNTDPKVLPVREKGNQVYLKINDAQLAMALRGVNRQKIDGLMRGVKAFTRFYSGLMTRFNPEFVVSNKVRDLQEVAVYLASKNEIGVRGAAETLIKDPISVKDVTDAMRGKDTAGARLYRQMKLDGGTTGGMGLSTREQLEINIDKIRAINRSNPRMAAQVVLRTIDKWNTIFEDSSRLSVYRQALKQGVSRNKAAVLAKEASVNFNKMGTGSPVVNALYMFSNASVQGTAKMLRAMRNPKVLATVLTLVGGAVFLVNEYNDKKDKDWRKKVSKWDRLNGLNIIISTDKGIKYVTIPVSWGLKPIKVFFDELGDLIGGHQTSVSKAVSGLVAATIESYNPAGGTDIVSSITPSILNLPVDIARNRSWTGGKIRPDWNNSAPASIKYFDSLKKKLSGQKFIDVTKELGDKSIEISPADLNYAFEQLIGGTGRTVTKTLNTIVGITKGKIQSKEIPFVSRFYRDIPSEEIREYGKDFEEIKKTLAKQDKARFYLGQEAELAWDGIKQIPVENRKEHFMEIRKTNPVLADKIKEVAKDEKLNLTYTDRLIKKLGVENGERSKFLWNKISKMTTTEERKTFYLNMKNKNVITDEVARQIKIRAKR